jgi:hypothetical protein
MPGFLPSLPSASCGKCDILPERIEPDRNDGVERPFSVRERIPESRSPRLCYVYNIDVIKIACRDDASGVLACDATTADFPVVLRHDE